MKTGIAPSGPTLAEELGLPVLIDNDVSTAVEICAGHADVVMCDDRLTEAAAPAAAKSRLWDR